MNAASSWLVAEAHARGQLYLHHVIVLECVTIYVLFVALVVVPFAVNFYATLLRHHKPAAHNVF